MRVFEIDGEDYEGVPATENESKELLQAGFKNEPCGRQECYSGWIWVLVDAPSGNGCQWYKTNVRCNE